jgi:pimeloyl-ACP methyl ester carboxylesterase
MSGIYRSADGARAVEELYRAFLARWPVPNEQLRLDTREGETFVVACGPPEAPPLLLLHGSAANSAMWMGDVAAWAEHFRVYAVDMIGEAGLSAPSRPPLASERYAWWLDDVLCALDVGGAVSIVGVSLGGWLALDYATRRPDRVERMALLCPGGVGRLKVGVLIAALALVPLGRWGRRTAMRLVLGEVPDAPGDYVMLVNKHFKPRKAVPLFADDTLRRLSVPTLVIVGGRDRLLDSAGTKRRLEDIAGAGRSGLRGGPARQSGIVTVRLLPDAGHLILGQTGSVLEFLSSGRPAAR